MNLYNIPTHKESPDKIWAVIEIPKGTSAKYEYDPELGIFIYDRGLLSAMTYPASYGFIPNTISEDGDALDVLVYNALPIERGTVVECNVIAVLDMEDEGEKDYKVLACPISHVRAYKNLDDIDPMFLKVCKNFFAHYKDLNEKLVNVRDWEDTDFARKVIMDSQKIS